MATRRTLRAILAASVLAIPAAAAGPASARIVPRPDPPPDFLPASFYGSFEIERVDLNVTVHNRVATTTVEEWIHNTSPGRLEARYLFPVPHGAAVTEFALWIDGERVDAEILDREEARRIYRDIVRRAIDPGLVEFYGDRLLCVRIFPVPPGGTRRIRLSYQEALAAESGAVRYQFPLRSECGGLKQPESMNISVEVEDRDPVQGVYSPSHGLDVERSGPGKVYLSSEGVRGAVRDFVLVYTPSERDFGAGMLDYRTGAEDGYFLAFLSPGPLLEDVETSPKDVLFVLDTSGSMKGRKIEQALGSLRTCLEGLREGDRFNLVDYASGVRSFAPELVPVDDRSRGDAIRYLEGVRARGGTNIHEALQLAFEQLREARQGRERPEGRRALIVFLTDGLPTVGERNVERILQAAEEANVRGARVFVLGVGYDVNTRLLDALYEDHRGAGVYVTPEESVEASVTALFDKIDSAALTDVSLEFSGVDVLDVLPRRPPDLFRGSQLVVVGRYRGSGSGTLRLSGRVSGRELSLSTPFRLRSRSVENGFVPRLWATQKIADLCDEIRRNGRDPELVDEVVALSLEHGIITEFTSFLVTEDEVALEEPAAWRERVLRGAAPGEGDLATGESAVRSSRTLMAFKGKAMGAGRPPMALEVLAEKEQELSGSDAARYDTRGGASFFQREGEMRDGRIDADGALHPDLVVRFGSSAYFALAELDRRLAARLSIAPRVTLKVGSLVVRVAEKEGTSEFSSDWIRRLRSALEEGS
jgi:uncharacterized protein YegL